MFRSSVIGFTSIVLSAASLLLVSAGVVRADFIWGGGGATDLWTDDDNWVPAGAPPFDLASDNLIFAATGVAQSPDAGADDWFNIASIAFTGADAELTLIGTGSLSFDDGATITNDSTFLQRINIDLIANGTDLIVDASTGDFQFGGGIDLSDTAGVDLTIMGSENTRINGVITGDDGKLIKDGTGILRLFGTNDYTGGTDLLDGTIVIGNDEALGSGRLTVLGDGTLRIDGNRTIGNGIRIDPGITLTIDGDDNLSVSGRLSGDGAVIYDATDDEDELTLTTNNTFTGGLTINKGTVVLGDDEALGTGALSLTGDGTIRSNDDDRVIANDMTLGGNRLTIGGRRDIELEGDISGAGGVTIDVDGTITLSGDSTYSGTTRLEQGTLFLEGFIDSRVIVRDLTILRGRGEVDNDLDLRSGALIAPGRMNRVGTLTVGGDYEQDRDATYEVHLDAGDGSADLIDIAGSALFRSGSVIEASLDTDSGYVVSGQQFTILEAVGGITDNGARIVSDSATLTAELVLDPDFMDGQNKYILEVFRADDAYSAAAMDGNNKIFGSIFDGLIDTANGDPTGTEGSFLGQLDGLDESRYNEALQQLSPEQHNAVAQVTFDSFRGFAADQQQYLSLRRNAAEGWKKYRRAVRNTPVAAGARLGPGVLRMDAEAATPEGVPLITKPDERTGIYFSGHFVDNRQRNIPDRIGYEAETGGGQVGLDYLFAPNLLAGILVDYTKTDGTRSANRGDFDVDTVRFGPYLTWTSGNLFVDAGFTGGYHTFDSTRRVTTLDLTAEGDSNAWDLSGFVGVGYDIELGSGYRLTPLVGARLMMMEIDGFTERNGGEADLRIEDWSQDSIQVRVGAELSGVIDVGFKLIPSFSLAWEHEFEDPSSIRATFIDLGQSFEILPGAPDKGRVVLGLGFETMLETNLSGWFRFQSIVAHDDDVNYFSGGVSLTF